MVRDLNFVSSFDTLVGHETHVCEYSLTFLSYFLYCGNQIDNDIVTDRIAHELLVAVDSACPPFSLHYNTVSGFDRTDDQRLQNTGLVRSQILRSY